MPAASESASTTAGSVRPPFGMSVRLARGLGFAYGLVSLSVLSFWAVWDGYFLRRPSAAWWDQVLAARDAHWNLSTRPFPGFVHHFHQLAPGRQIHYLSNSPSGPDKHEHLVVFIHGWPDSSLLWRQVLTSLPASTSASAKLVALDLPGSGGSDNAYLDYGPEGVLSALATFILAMRDLYLAEGGKVTIVGHDWGCLLAFRLAAEAPQLASRFICVNGGIAAHIRSNIQARSLTAVRLFKQWLAAPTRWSLLRSAATTLRPVLNQLRSSTYIALFNLPAPIPAIFGAAGGEWFLRFACSLASGAQNCTFTAATAAHVANATGPSPKTLSTATAAGETYGIDVAKRAASGRFFERVKIYRDGVLGRRWDKSLDLVAALHALPQTESRSSGAGLLDNGPRGSCAAPTTVVFGCLDVALQKEIFLEGISDYLPVKGSGVVEVKDAAHWVPAEARGASVIAEIVRWSVEGEAQSLQEVLQGQKGVEVKHQR